MMEDQDTAPERAIAVIENNYLYGFRRPDGTLVDTYCHGAHLAERIAHILAEEEKMTIHIVRVDIFVREKHEPPGHYVSVQPVFEQQVTDPAYLAIQGMD